MRPYRKTALFMVWNEMFVNYYIPFQVERLDSLLRARLSQYDFQIAFLPEGDTLSRFNSWKFYRNICSRLAWELNTGMLRWSGKG